MDVQIARFRELLELLKPAVDSKTKIESLQGILIKDGQAVATDLETMIVVKLPEADITSLVPITDVMKVLQYVSGAEKLHIEVKKKNLSLSWPDGSANFPVGDPADFPPVPAFDVTAEESLNSDELIPALDSVLSYAAIGADRPVLQGVTLILGNPIEVAAGDGYRMAHKVLTLSFPSNFVAILPASSVRALSHLWKKTPRSPTTSKELIPILMAKKQVMVAYDGKTGLRFQFNRDTTAIVKLVSGKPPDWLKLIPREPPTLKVHMWAPELELAVRRVARVAEGAKGIVRLVFSDSEATISAKGDDQEVKSSISTLNAEGVPNKVALNVSYLLGYLKGKEGIISVAWTGGTAPLVFQSQNSPSVLIMPMQAQW